MSQRKRLMTLLVAAGLALAQGQDAREVDLRGTVNHGKDGSPVAGATVRLALYPELKAVTDAAGRFAIQGRAVAVAGRSVPGGRTRRADRRLVLRPGQGDLPVTEDLFDPAGRALRKVRRGFLPPALAKASASAIQGDEPDTLLITKTGFRTSRKVLAAYAGTFPILLSPKLPPGKVKVYSEREMPPIDWGANVEVHNWDGATLLDGKYPAHFEGDRSWMARFDANQAWSGWAFAAKSGTPEDLGAWAEGWLHLAVKGTVPDLAVLITSEGQGPGVPAEISLAAHGYLPDDAWHEMHIPMSAFVGTDLTRVSAYCAFVAPGRDATAPFDPASWYQVDDIYYTLAKDP